MPVDIEAILKEKAPFIDKIIERYIPRRFDEKSIEFICGPARYVYNTEAPTKALAEPIWEFLDRGGKRWRPTLFLLVAEALGGDIKKLEDFVIISEVVHNGSLMIDDLEDSSLERRGKPCTYLIYGTDIAVNAGNAMYFIPAIVFNKKMNEFSKDIILKAYSTFLQELTNIHFGQAMDIAWHKGIANADNVTEQEYLQMCAYKTGVLARLSAKLAAILSGADDRTIEALGRYAEAIGIAFQIQDDILNLVGEKFAAKKGGFGEDITEGKRSLMVIYTLKHANSSDRKRLLEILNMHTTDQALRNEAIEIIKKYGSIEYAKEFARKILKESWAEIDPLLSPSEAKEKIKAFADYLVERDI